MNKTNDPQPASTFLTYGEHLLEVRKKWFKRTLVIAVAATVISFLIPSKFRSSTSIVTQNSDNSLSLLGSFADIASLAGINVTSVSPVDLYPAIISSDIILSEVLREKFHPLGLDSAVMLYDILGIQQDDSLERIEDGLKYFRENVLDLSSDKKTGIVTVEIETRYADLSASVVNSLVRHLDEYMRLKRRTTATEQRAFIETRLQQVDHELLEAEDSLRLFKERNRSRVASPELQMEESRLSRKVDIALVIFTELKKQYELVKIEEVKNTTIIQVLDEGRIPARRSWPKRGLIVLMTTFLGSLVVMAHLLLQRSAPTDGPMDSNVLFIKKAFNEFHQDIVGMVNLFRKKNT